jgi:transcriptional regulator with XRE-family HTH domain
VSKRAELVAVGTALRTLREVAGLTQEELADKAFIHRTFVGRYERAERNVGILTIRKVLVALDRTWPDFARELDKLDPLRRPARREDRRRT